MGMRAPELPERSHRRPDAPPPTRAEPPERLWTHPETAEFLGLPPSTLHQLNHKGVGPRSFKVGKHRRYDPADVMAWLDSRASEPRGAA
jgi:predicted DNA-binding transcriptional regulator AlpA